MSATIYQITNKINGKSYIGFDSNYPNRIKQHQNPKDSPYLYNAIMKYGWENFSHKVLYEGEDPKHTLNVMEPYFIRKHKTKKPNGYNLADGGKGPLGCNWKLSAGTKRKMSKAKSGKVRNPHTEETKKKMSIIKSGKKRERHIYGT